VSDAAPTPEQETREGTLVNRLKIGDHEAYETIVRRHAPALLATCRRILRNDEDARDAVQEAFLCAFRAIGTFEGQARVYTWLHRIAVNACLMKLRSRRCRPEEPLEALLPRFLEDGHHVVHPPAWCDRADRILQRREEREHVRGCIDALPESHRLVIMLRDVEEMSTQETARTLGLTEGVVKTRLHRARQALRALLEARYAAHPV
jgi:RNA polymerase sigma-70 factor (ECF subfamily)